MLKSPVSVTVHYFLLQAEKRKLFYIFLKQFLIIYKSWEPIQPGQFTEVALYAAAAADHIDVNDIVVGCSTGHPAEIILTLIEEITHLTALVTECKLAFTCDIWCMDSYYLLS